jgi:hypothetical protein
MVDDRDRMGLWRAVQRALFMFRLRRLNESEEPEYGEVVLNLRLRRALRMMLREPERPWTMAEFAWVSMMSTVALQEVIDRLSRAALAEQVWIDRRRCVRLSEYGRQEVPEMLAAYRSQRLIVILLRDGPTAAQFAWAVRRRRRQWQRQLEADKKDSMTLLPR